MYCPSCGKPTQENAKYCPHCGSRLPVAISAYVVEDAATQPQTEARHSTRSFAGFWKRAGAAIIDSLILAFLGTPLLVGFAALISPLGLSEGGFATLFWLFSVSLGWLYFSLLESSRKQATLGKMALSIKVVDLQGKPVSFARASGRHFAKLLSTLLFGIGYLMAAFTERKQALHDMVAGCLIVNRQTPLAPIQRIDASSSLRATPGYGTGERAELEATNSQHASAGGMATLETPAALDSQAAESHRHKKSYISRHWSGDLSLGVSYWVNGVLLTFILLAILTLASSSSLDLTPHPKFLSLSIIALWALVYGVSIWQLVGTWRSAAKHVTRGGLRVWAVLAQIAVVLGWLQAGVSAANNAAPQILAFSQILFGKDPLGDYQIRILRNASELEILGDIGFGLVDEVKKTLDAHPTVRLVHLNSQGGRIGEARRLADLIESRSLSTYTSSGCSSACTVAFIAGKERLIATDANLGFHEYYFPGVDHDEMRRQQERDKRFFQAKGVTANFVTEMFLKPYTEVWNPNHDELLRARVITRYPEEDEVGLSGIKPSDSAKIEEFLAKKPVYVALRSREPETYERIVTELRSGFQRGMSLTEVRVKTMPLVVEVYRKRLPYASDDVLRSAVKLLLDEMDSLYQKDPELCYQFLYPEHDKPIAWQHLKEFNDREIALMTAVITSGRARKLPAEKAIEQPLLKVLARLRNRYGDQVKLIFEPNGPGVDKAKVCVLTYAFFEEVQTLPDKDEIATLAYMFSHM